jgi:hypothetical protein
MVEERFARRPKSRHGNAPMSARSTRNSSATLTGMAPAAARPSSNPEHFTERLEAARKKAMRVPILRSAWPRSDGGCNLVALEYLDLFEMACQYRRCGRAPDAAANHHRVPPEEIVHVGCYTRFASVRRATAAGYNAISKGWWSRHVGSQSRHRMGDVAFDQGGGNICVYPTTCSDGETHGRHKNYLSEAGSFTRLFCYPGNESRKCRLDQHRCSLLCRCALKSSPFAR